MKRLTTLIPLALICLAFSPKVSQAATFNVTTSSGGGGVPACAADVNDPKINCNLQEALSVAESNGADDTINLAAGSGGNYNTASNGNAPFIYNSSEDNSLTVIGAGVGATILDGGGTGGSEVMQLMTSGPTAGIQVSNATFQNGAVAALFTGGLEVGAQGGVVSIESCEFKDNHGDFHGGASAHTVTGNISFNNNILSGNIGDTFSGGAAIFTDQGTINLNGNTFTSNQGGFDGGCEPSSNTGNITISGNTFTGNTGTTFDGGIGTNSSSGNIIFNNNILSGNKGGFDGNAVSSSSGSMTVFENTVTGNTGTTFEGGILAFSSSGNVIFNHNTLKGNNGGFDGGANVSSNSGSVTVDGNTVDGNIAAIFNGGILVFTDTGVVSFINNTLLNNKTNNIAGVGGASVSANSGEVDFINNIVSGNSSLQDGGGAMISSSSTAINIINNTVTNNTAVQRGGGLLVLPNTDATATNIFNNIIFGNVGTSGQGEDFLVDNSSGPNAVIMLFNNDFTEGCFDNGGGPNCDFGAVLGGNQGANINADPLLIDPANGNFQLGEGSPAIDTGTDTAPALPATDHDGNPRIFGIEPDMGALEALPSILVDPTALDFGELLVGQQASQIVTITNLGSVGLTVSGMTLSDDQNYSIDPNGGPNPCGSLTPSLATGESCTVSVIFEPTADGVFNAILIISSNDPLTPEVQVTLTGVGKLLSLSGSGGCSLGGAMPSSSYLYFVLPFLLMGMRRWIRKS